MMSENEKPSTPDKDAPEQEEKVTPVAGKVMFKGEIEIFPSKRLPHMDKGPVKAYEAKGKDGGLAFAMLCEKPLIPQAELAPKYVGVITNHMPRLIGAGVVFWPPTGKQHSVFIYENKLGRALANGRNPNCMGIKADLVIGGVFRNMVENLRSMADANFVHGNICTSNLFDGGTEGYENVMLGEMLSVPFGFAQPILFETIARSVANPLGKGTPAASDDMYAFGVMLATLIRTHDPLDKMSDQDIVAKKIEASSFNTIIGQERFPGPVLELLRGLLADNEDLRWSIDDVLEWMEGRRVSAKQTAASITKASRPLDFSRKKYLRPQHLAMHLMSDLPAAVSLVENGDLYLWLNRSLQNKEYEDRYEEAVVASKRAAGGSNYADRVASYIAMAMAPGIPILYKDIRAMPGGLGSMIANAVSAGRDLAQYVDLLQSDMPIFWSKCNINPVGDSSDAVTKLETCSRFLKQSTVGYGIERCVYYLSPSAPCLSEKLAKFYVRNSEEFVQALESMATEKDRPEWFLDRHSIAFLCVRDKTVIEPFLADLNATEKHRQCMAALKVFSSIQKRERMGPLPGLSQWIAGMMTPAINRYHDREKRVRVVEQLEMIKARGELDKIADLFDNFQELQVDLKTFAYAMRQYQALKNEYKALTLELNTNQKFGISTGRQTSMVVSGIVASIVVVIYLVFSLMNGK